MYEPTKIGRLKLGHVRPALFDILLKYNHRNDSIRIKTIKSVDNKLYHCLLFNLFLIYKHTHTVFVNQVTFFNCHSRLFWYKILNTKYREVCKIRKRPFNTYHK